MPLITLKRYLNSWNEASEFRRAISLLLQAMELQTVEADRADYQKFRRDFDRMQSSCKEDASGQELLVLTGAAIHAFAEYGQSSARFIDQQRTLLANMVSMLTETMIGLGTATKQSSETLHEIKKRLARAIELEEIRELKRRLKECLDSLSEEAERQKVHAHATVQHLEAQIANAQNNMKSIVANESDTDPLTGLANRTTAKMILEDRLAAPGGKYVVVAVVNRLGSINARFGYEAGDEVLKIAAEFLRRKLLASDILFRWTGPAFVVLLERDQTIDSVRADISKFIHTRIEKTIELEGRSVMIPLNVSWLVIPLAAPLSELVGSIEKFISSQIPKEAVQ